MWLNHGRSRPSNSVGIDGRDERGVVQIPMALGQPIFIVLAGSVLPARSGAEPDAISDPQPVE